MTLQRHCGKKFKPKKQQVFWQEIRNPSGFSAGVLRTRLCSPPSAPKPQADTCVLSLALPCPVLGAGRALTPEPASPGCRPHAPHLVVAVVLPSALERAGAGSGAEVETALQCLKLRSGWSPVLGPSEQLSVRFLSELLGCFEAVR
jgi:hypothetical protein